MFMIKSIFGRILGDPQNPEIVQLKAGMLFLVRPDSIKGSRECIFKDAVATVRRTTAEHQYQLVITRAYEEGEAELLDGDAETEDERSFLIDHSLNFRATSFEGEPSFAWRDISYDDEDDDEDTEGSDFGEGGELFEFVTDSKTVSKATVREFEQTMLRCMYERKFNRNSTDATEADLEDLRYKPQWHPSRSLSQSASPSNPVSGISRDASLEDAFDNLAVSGTPSKAPAAAIKPKVAASSSASAATAASTLSSSSAAAIAEPVKPARKGAASPATASTPAGSTNASTALSPAQQPSDTTAIVQDESGEEMTEELPVVYDGEAEIYLFDAETDYFVVQGQVRLMIVQKQTKSFDYWFACYSPAMDKYIISQPIEGEMNSRWMPDSLAYMWNFIPLEDGFPPSTWSIRFSNPEAYLEFNHTFTRCLWEKSNQMSWGKAKASDQAYVLSAYNNDVEMKDIDEGDEDEEEEERERVEREEDEEEEEKEEPTAQFEDDSSDEEDTEDSKRARHADGAKNEQLAIGYKHDRSFVVRGNNIGVFRHTDDDAVKFSTQIRGVKTTKGKEFAPKKVMLHNEDSSMLMMNPDDPHSIFRMDLEYGKVVEEWKVHDSVKVDNIVPDNKFAQMTAEQTVIGHSHNGLFRIDPRQSGVKIVENQFKQYASKNDFSAAVTTASGKIAVASNKGDIRLFDQVGKIAKTALLPLGEPIIGVDVTADGRWLIATCKTYLLLIDTLIGDGRYKGSLGFDRSFPADSKPIPRRLQLRPEHVHHMETSGGAKVSFTPARFNTGSTPEESEKSIITSSGQFVITWNFRRAQQGKTDDYHIKRYDDKVVADNFRHGTNKNIVVALPNDVFMVNKKQLAKPTRESLSTPTRLLKSRSSVVNAPY